MAPRGRKAAHNNNNSSSSSSRSPGCEKTAATAATAAKKASNRRQLLWPAVAIAAVAVAIAVGLAAHRSNSNGGDGTDGDEVLASAGRRLESPIRRQFPCSEAFTRELRERFPACLPSSGGAAGVGACGRFVDDSLATPAEAASLLRLARRGLALGGGSGGASILDLHSGALSRGDKFVDVYSLTAAAAGATNGGDGRPAFEPTDAERRLYADVVDRIRAAVAAAFGVAEPSALRLTRPTFFSRLTGAPARTPHDEYWHVHVDKDTYGSFHYTSLLYLADYGTDFTGGRFAFVPAAAAAAANGTAARALVEPRVGRVSAFTSGAENTHMVEPVATGERFALTIAFTCDPAAAIEPTLGRLRQRQQQ